MRNKYRLAFDIGGTFTDFVLYDPYNNKIMLNKCLTTPSNFSKGVINGIIELLEFHKIDFNQINQIVHGTTLVSNTIIERTGSKVGLLTTDGFRDILEIGREQRYDIHDLFLEFPKPLVERDLCIDVKERIGRDGQVIKSLDQNSLISSLSKLVLKGVESVAICFLHSYSNPSHEILAREVIFSKYPEIQVTISSEINPELKEYERTSTTVANAYVKPLMSKYIKSLEKYFFSSGFKGSFLLMQSSGGLSSPETAIEMPIRFLESGPAGGAQASSWIDQQVGGHHSVISFDMGGTTAKSCLITNGNTELTSTLEAGRVHRFKKGSGLPIRSTTIDMIEIGAGGGSISRLDEMDLMKVGPKSSGADPGPACYGRGGEEPTITDANVLLGYIDPNYFLGGKIKLYKKKAELSFQKLSEKLSIDSLDAAWGAYEIVCENMASATRVHIVERGYDPRDFSMIAMGGAGPAHAVNVARKLGISKVLIPKASGAASAFGMLVAPVSFFSKRSLPSLLDEINFLSVNSLLKKLEEECLTKLKASGIKMKDIEVQRFAEMRLSGQIHDITISLPNRFLDIKVIPLIEKKFTDEYTKLYTHLFDGAKIQIINWLIICKSKKPVINNRLIFHKTVKNYKKGILKAYFPENGGLLKTSVYDRYSLPQGRKFKGPAIIQEIESTIVIPPDSEFNSDEFGNIVISLKKKKENKKNVSSHILIENEQEKLESDPIGLEIMWSRLINITEECWQTIIRTAFSLIIGESQDFACELLDEQGNQLVHSPRAMPVFNICLPIAVKAMLDRHPLKSLNPGDVLVTNDPWFCAGHLNDIAFAAPVFKKGKIVSFVGIVGHVSDIGGIKNNLEAKEIYDEGLQIPPMKIMKNGLPNKDLLEIISQNVRNSSQVLGDIHALISATKIGTQRILEFMEDYGIVDLKALAKVVQSRADKAVRRAIKQLPNGIYTNEIWADGVNFPLKFPVQVIIKEDQISIDFKGAPNQLPSGGSNATFNYTLAHSTYPLKCMLTPEIPSNSGCYNSMTVSAPKKSILNCEKSLSVNARIRTGWYIGPNIYGALAKAVPKRVQAFTGLPSSAYFYGKDQNSFFKDHLFQGGGQGASEGRDGKSALLWPTSSANTSIEMFETRVPLLVLEKSLIQDSCGAGKFRGGLGQKIRVKKLNDDNSTIEAGLFPNGVLNPPNGLLGGRAGSVAGAFLSRHSDTIKDLGIGTLVELSNYNDFVELRIAGGAGFGDPLLRDKVQIIKDIEQGYISEEYAKKEYGYKS
jgi:5-oxoprolinase (ATP-hydrolysing)